MSDWERSSTARVIPPARPRKLAKVPFVELADGRLQGVVSSGSDIGRVYVSSVAAGTYAFACSTNNNRPCGGARGSFCNHIGALINEAVLQYGAERVVRYLKAEVPEGEVDGAVLASAMRSTRPCGGRDQGRRLRLQPLPAPPGLPRTPGGHGTVARDAVLPADPGGGLMRTGLLTEPLDGLDEALEAVDAFDRALVAGLLRPQADGAAGPARLADAVAGTPLAARVAEAAAKAAAGVAGEDHFVALAAARTALLGSVHDALLARVEEAVGRTRGADTAPAAAERPCGRESAHGRPRLALGPGALRLAGPRPRGGVRGGRGRVRDAPRPVPAPPRDAPRRFRRRTRRVLPRCVGGALPGTPMGRPVVARDAADGARSRRCARDGDRRQCGCCPSAST